VKRLLSVGLFLISFTLFAQKKNETFQYRIRQTAEPIKVDGSVEEAGWQQAEVTQRFFMVLPMDTSAAQVRTEVRMTYDAHNLYISAVCYHALPGPNMVESLKRDWNFGRNDNFIFFMDPFDDQTNGFTFGVNAAGAEWDGLLFEGGKANLSWTNRWTSKVRNYDDRWVFEAAIPFKTLRYKRGITRWGINFSRLDLKTTEKSAWAPVPRQFPTASLAYTGVLLWDQPPPTPGPNVSIIPYVLGGYARNFAENKPTDPYRKEIGGDIKVAVTPALNLDLTANPDFSQVDVDRQVVNVDRFELFFPEQRQFFLENGDLFNNFGYQTIRPFFSRRIGLNAPIQFGARLSGKLNKDWRIGVMDMQTGEVADQGLPRQNFAVVALQRQVFARSTIEALLINKETLPFLSQENQAPGNRFNRNVGLEYNLASSNNQWTGKALMLKSFTPNRTGDDFVYAGNLLYNNRHWIIGSQYEYVGANYNPEVGYVPRRGYHRSSSQLGYLFFPKGGRILTHGPTLHLNFFFDKAYRPLDNTNYLTYNLTFRDRSIFTGWVATDWIRLTADLDPTNMGKARLKSGTIHNWRAWGTEFVSKPQSLFTYGFSTRYGGFYNGGDRLNITTDLGYRFQPFVSLGVTSSYNRIWLPELSGITRFWLIGPRVDVTMTNTLFFTAFMQYNEQAKNVNLNTRLQWRYKPASDLFIVYTDNYIPGSFLAKNRALVLKLTYWWNL